MKHLILDWGGVLTIGRHTKTIHSLINKDYKAMISYKDFEALVVLMDKNKLSGSKLNQIFKEKYKINMNLSKLKDYFNKGIISNDLFVDYVKKISSKKYILSDNNEFTVDILRKKYKNTLSMFNKIFFSCEVGYAKPDRRFFDFVLNDLKLKAKDCVFVDDKKKNIIGAKKVGLNTILFTDNETVIKKLKKFGFSVNRMSVATTK